MKQRTRKMFQAIIVFALALSLFPMQPAFAQDSADIVDTAVAAGNFNTLVAAVQAAGLVDTLKGEGPFTVFAPTDEAFAKLPPETLAAALADPQGLLTQVLLYHVVPGKVMAADLSDGMEATTAQGEAVKFTLGDASAMVNNANIIATDIETSNGVIHVIDTVILPPSITGAAAAEEAMTEEPVVEEMVTEEPAAEASSAEATMEMADIVDTAVAAGSFNTLVAAVQAAGLVDALKGDGPFTVFAPTDEAFAKLPAGAVDALLADPSGDLTQILLYHVVPGKVMAADLSDGLEAATLQGDKVTFKLSDGGAMVNDANIVATDIETSNGVIHVIDSVIMPPVAEAAPVAETAPATDAAPAAEMAADQAPDRMPVTGGEANNGLNMALIAGLVVFLLGGLAVASRRRIA
ncbi:MAG: fasciclin domain-containing protein [Caldilinea sp.]|uniref:fasciclin domain-containing protein n=1 Tax=Caldilinea sp. TaxID=2293560 RepID=UPI002BA93767|nr:fasciclin domain-containing protein [Caldilinea sp.]